MRARDLARAAIAWIGRASRTSMIAAALFCVGALHADAQSGQTIRFIIGAAPGGPVELYARIVAEHMAKTLGATIVIETRPGANGNVAAQMVADLPADGLSVWVATQSMIEINPLVYPGLRWSADDFTPIIKGVEAPLALVVNPETPPKTLAELVDWVKKNPNTLSITSYSPGTPGHFLGVQMNEKFGLDLAQVPYKGSAPQMTDLLGGYAKIGFTQTSPVLPYIQSGGLRAIATTGAKRYGSLPDTPTFAELGYPDFLATVWYGFLVHAKTPPEIIARLVEAARKAHADPAVRAALAPLGLDVVAITGPEFRQAIGAGTEHWRRIVAATGFKATE